MYIGGTFQYTHDENGNIIKAGASDFVFNSENQLEQFIYNGSLAASYEYDWRGLRTKKTTGSKTEAYYYTGNELSYITDGANNLKYYFVRDTNGRLLQMIDYTASPAKSYIYILDVHGNVIGLADETGILVNYEYDAYGYPLNTPQTNVLTGNGESLATANPFRYSGYQFDPETGFYYLKYRYYVPSLGRFLTRDPMVSYNRYRYCNNNPVSFVDSLGLYVPMPELNSVPPAGPRRPKEIQQSVIDTLNSPSTVLTTTTTLSTYILQGLQKSAIKATINQTFPSSIAKGMRPKIIQREIDELNSIVGKSSKALSVLGDYGSPVLDLLSGIYTLNQDKINYTGSNLNRAQLVTYYSTILSVGAGFALIGAFSSVAAGLAVGILVAIAISAGANYIKDLVTRD